MSYVPRGTSVSSSEYSQGSVQSTEARRSAVHHGKPCSQCGFVMFQVSNMLASACAMSRRSAYVFCHWCHSNSTARDHRAFCAFADVQSSVVLQEMNPASPSFKVVLGNPIAYAAFKSTDPWLLEYMALDLGELAQSAGFVHVAETSSTPSHKTFIACKST